MSSNPPTPTDQIKAEEQKLKDAVQTEKTTLVAKWNALPWFVKAAIVVVIVTFVFLVFHSSKARAGEPAHWGNPSVYNAQTTVDPSTTLNAPVNSSISSTTHAYGWGSASPAAGVCQGVVLWGFTYPVKTCQLQEWMRVLGEHPTRMQLQMACQDELLGDLPMCKGYKVASKPALGGTGEKQ